MWERSAKSLAQCRKKMQENKREFVGKDLLLGKRTVSFQAINKGTLWGHKEGRGAIKEEACPVKLCSIKKKIERLGFSKLSEHQDHLWSLTYSRELMMLELLEKGDPAKS